MNYIPIINESKDDYIRVREYLIEFLEELRQRNKSKLVITNQQNGVYKKKPIQIEVKIIEPTKMENEQKVNAQEEERMKRNNSMRKSLEPKMRPKKKRSFKFMRYIPEQKLSLFEDITLRKIEEEYKAQEDPHTFRRSLFEDMRVQDSPASSSNNRANSINKNKASKPDPISKSLQELLNVEFNPVETKYSFYNDFCQRLKQNDPYYINNSNLAANYPSLNIIH